MKIVTQEIIEDIYNARFKIQSSTDVVQLCNELMAKYEEKEKQQIVNFATEVKDNFSSSKFDTVEDYFDYKFK